MDELYKFELREVGTHLGKIHEAIDAKEYTDVSEVVTAIEASTEQVTRVADALEGLLTLALNWAPSGVGQRTVDALQDQVDGLKKKAKKK